MIKEKIWYYRRLWGSASILIGAFLLIEHIYQWGFQAYDIIGHEYLGLLLVLIGCFAALRK